MRELADDRSAPMHRVRGVGRARTIAADEGEHEAELDPTLPDPDILVARDEAGSRSYAMLRSVRPFG
jgi:hypothetical protein